MADQQSNIPENSTQEIPAGYCQCGCGQRTQKWNQNHSKRGWVKGQYRKFVGTHGNGKGSLSHGWKGGKTHRSDGYIGTWMPDHPRADKNGYVPEHVVIAEKSFGKILPPGAVVHHTNGSKDNGPLVICQDLAYHNLIHQRQRAYENCGHANWRKCQFCQKYDDPQNLHISKQGKADHQACRNAYKRKRRVMKK